MNEHALRVLEYADALELVASRAGSALGAAAVRALRPSDAPVEVEDELARVEEMIAFTLGDADWTVPAVPDLRAPLRKLGVPDSVWEGTELWEAGVLIRSARSTRRAVLRFAETHRLLAELARRLVELAGEEERLTRAVDAAGEVRDDASRDLRDLRRELRGARGRIVQALERFMASLPDRARVADASVTVREGRYVIPIRREARSEVGGLVHDESGSGATLFVEPPVAIELMNRLRELERAEAREVRRILGELTDRLRPHREPLVASLDALVALDSLYARARYALELHAKRPALATGRRRAGGVADAGDDAAAAGRAEFAIVAGRHPLLLARSGGEVVPFDLRLDAEERTLLVSGPNTGGKTVLLKAVGLISALTQAGVIPPVGEGTRIPVFRDIFADIGDEQSIEASLSTFSAHLRNLREIVETADARCLVLIDEIGSGTDPLEGAALARAILVELTRRGMLTIATSHLGELKRLAGEEPGVVNASLQFDADALRPTYRLVKGLPGRSYGLAIARRLGLSSRVLELAESLLPAEEREAGQLLAELEAKETRLTEALQQAESARSESDRLCRELEEREAALRRREKDAEARARQQARDLLLAAREEVESAIRELREAMTADAGVAFDERARAARRRVELAAKRQAERTASATSRSVAAEAVRPATGAVPGQRVRIMSTGASGTLVELRDGRATVETGGVRLQVPATDLEPLAGEPSPERPAGSTGSGGGWTGPSVDASPEVDLRGLRAEEARGRLEPALDAAVQADLRSLRIIHGKGTGALRELVFEVLRTDPRVAGMRPGGPGEGGAGVTVAELA